MTRSPFNGHKVKLSVEQVLHIREAVAAGTATKTELARKYGVKMPSIHKVVRRETWKRV